LLKCPVLLVWLIPPLADRGDAGGWPALRAHLLTDHFLQTSFLHAAGGGDRMFEHIFGFFGHPEAPTS